MATIFPGFDLEGQTRKGVAALKKFEGVQAATSSGKLLDVEDPFLHLSISLKKTYQGQGGRDKPKRIAVPHPIFDFSAADVCLLVKDKKDGSGGKGAKKQLAAYQGKAGISKVVGTSKLRTKYESFEAKRTLCNQYDLFLADERILPSLPKLIGKQFFKRKKQPIPINLTAKDWKQQFDKVANSAFFFTTGGSYISIKVARVSQSDEEILENVRAVLTGALQHIPKKWDNVQALFLKTADSVALPLYQSVPDDSSATHKASVYDTQRLNRLPNGTQESFGKR